MYTLSKFNKPNLDVKSVFVYFNGIFPKKAYPDKDVSLPKRLFPNATKFYIRCHPIEKNYEYFRKLYNDKNIELVFISPDYDDYNNLSSLTDVMYTTWTGFDAYQKQLAPFKISFHYALVKYKNPICMFMNEPSCSSFKSIIEYLEKLKSYSTVNQLQNYKKLINAVNTESGIYVNLNILVNDTPFEKDGSKNWWEGKLKEISKSYNFNVLQLSDSIIYDLPISETVIIKHNNKTNTSNKGIWLGTCGDSRVRYLNKTFKTKNLLNLSIMGRGVDAVNLYVDKTVNDYNIPNNMLPQIFAEHDYSLYFSRGCFVNMLGATFYEPLLNGLPQFIDVICDPHKEIFPDIDCYYSNEQELKQLVDSSNLKELWVKQIEHIL